MTRLIALVIACGCLPPDKSDTPATAVDPALAMVVHPWIIENHVLAGNSTLTEGDAMMMHGRKIDISATGYRTPFHGTCEGASREQRTRPLTDVSADADLAGERRQVPVRFGLPAKVTELHFTCTDNKRTPSLTIVVGDKRAMTCFSGVCYLLVY